MDFAIQIGSYIIGIPLQLLTISALLRGGYRRFPLIFVYVIALFLATVSEMPLAFSFLRSQRKLARALVKIYYTNEIVLQLLIYAVVISLLYEATARVGPRRLLRAALIGGAALAAAISWLIHYDATAGIGLWMTPLSRDLKLCAVVLDLALWGLLLSLRQKDRLVLLLSGAMGILFTGEAIGESLRSLATPHKIIWLSRIGTVLLVVANNVFLYIWWRAFRQQKITAPLKRVSPKSGAAQRSPAIERFGLGKSK